MTLDSTGQDDPIRTWPIRHRPRHHTLLLMLMCSLGLAFYRMGPALDTWSARSMHKSISLGMPIKWRPTPLEPSINQASGCLPIFIRCAQWLTVCLAVALIIETSAPIVLWFGLCSRLAEPNKSSVNEYICTEKAVNLQQKAQLKINVCV